MFVVIYRKLFYALSLILVIGSIVSMSVWGLKLGIDFKGGSLIEIAYPNKADMPTREDISAKLAPLSLQESIRSTGSDGYIIRMRDITPAEKQELNKLLGEVVSETAPKSSFIEKRFDSIGPILGKEAARKSVLSIIIVLIAIVFFVAYAFRKVSQPVSSWKYGLIAIIALAHDVIIPMGAFSVLGHFYGYEVDTLFVTALLVVLGFSVHDTIVVFDRVREHLNANGGNWISKMSGNKGNKESGDSSSAKALSPFARLVGESIRETFARSINTSLTTVIALVVLYLIGGESTQHFTLALIIGIVAGTYSSIFVGSPLLVTVDAMQKNRSK